MSGPPPATCVRHPERPTGLTCTRCGRPACPECLREASVGHQCVDCVQQAARSTPRARTAVGARLGGRSVVVPTLIAVNVAIFVLTVAQAGAINGNDAAPLFTSWSLRPSLVADGQWWRLLTSGFLHFGLLHLLANMYALWALGQAAESALGRWRFLAVYMIALLGGSAAVMLTAGNAIGGGASAAVFGVMGGLIVLFRRARVPAGQLIAMLLLNLAIGLFILGPISLIAHIGGLVVGAAATAALIYAPARNRLAVQSAALGGLTVLVLALSAVGALLLF